jgi:hypothetical protein
MTLQDQIGKVVVCREDGRVTIRFDNGRLLMGRDVESFERVLDQKEEMSRVVGSAPWTPKEDERLRVLALSGTSVAAIAKQMKLSTAAGDTCSEFAVVGARHAIARAPYTRSWTWGVKSRSADTKGMAFMAVLGSGNFEVLPRPRSDL